VKRDTQGRYPATPGGWNIMAMDNNLHSFLIAQHVQDRMAAATAARTARAAKLEHTREPRRYSSFRRIHKPEFMSLAKM
jgi:hypothetical protein